MADRCSHASVRFLMGIGFDNDGHSRVTKGEEFLLLGGSEETHGAMQDGVVRFQETLERMGTDLQTASEDEMLEAAYESGLLDD